MSQYIWNFMMVYFGIGIFLSFFLTSLVYRSKKAEGVEWGLPRQHARCLPRTWLAVPPLPLDSGAKAMNHRPMPNGDCTCGKYVAGDWEGHRDDLLVIEPDAVWDSRPLSDFEFALRPFVARYIDSLKEIGKVFRKIAEGMNTIIIKNLERKIKQGDFVIPPSVYEIPDQELPGMWTKSDFEGGDPDERSYAQRCLEGDHLFTNFKDNDHTLNQHLKCVYCGQRADG